MTPAEVDQLAGRTGLTSAEAAERRRLEGDDGNRAGTTSRSVRQIVVANVFTRFNAILAALLGVIIVVGPFQDGLFGVVLVLNTTIGIAQELRAKLTLDRLALLHAPQAHVERDGALVDLGLDELVVDDVVTLRRGDQVPLDGVVLDGTLQVDESLLSGESDPVAKPPGSTVLSASFVSSGSGRYLVTTKASDSYAQQLAREARRFTLARSELRDGVDRILQLVQWILIPVASLLVISQLVSHRNLPDAIRGCVAGVGAMIPQGLVLLTSVAFAIAVVRLARRRVLCQELAAVEGLARVDVLCVDKTGTLTAGGMQAEDAELCGQLPAASASLALGALAGADPDPNPTLRAIAGRWPAPQEWQPSGVVPFSSLYKWSGADFGPHGVWVLGAPEVVLDGDAASVRDRADALAAEGHRVVLLATVPGPLEPGAPPQGAVPVALVTLRERVRADAAETLRYFAEQGVAVRVVSGDHPMAVGVIAAAVGVPGAPHPVDARAVNDVELADLVESRSVFGRVTPRQKRAMVQALQAHGHVVAMTGDGVNDVLALKEADVGVAMGSGSAATRSVAQVVLLDDAFSSLPPVIGEGRRVMANIERVANLFLVKTVYATLFAVVVGLTAVAYPFLPRHITVIDDVTIGVPAFFLALLPNLRPFRSGFVARVMRFSVPSGLIAGSAALTAYFLADRAHLPVATQRSTATVVLALCGMWVLVLLARPFNAYKAAVVAAAAGVLVLVFSIPRVRSYFALVVPPGTQRVEAAVLVVVAWVLLEVTYRLVRQAAALDVESS
jgi:cation-transporting ATPase E